jgi:hypothetical protein
LPAPIRFYRLAAARDYTPGIADGLLFDQLPELAARRQLLDEVIIGYAAN